MINWFYYVLFKSPGLFSGLAQTSHCPGHRNPSFIVSSPSVSHPALRRRKPTMLLPLSLVCSLLQHMLNIVCNFGVKDKPITTTFCYFCYCYCYYLDMCVLFIIVFYIIIVIVIIIVLCLLLLCSIITIIVIIIN